MRFAKYLYIGARVYRKGYGYGTVICKPKNSIMIGVEFDTIVELGHTCRAMPIEYGRPGRLWHCLYLVPKHLHLVSEGTA